MKNNKLENNKKQFPLEKVNYIIIAISVVICVIGYMMMSGGGTDDPNVFNAEELYSFRRITLSVIFILLGHTMTIVGIMYKKKTIQ